jgi:hypothetical protein
MVVLMKVPFLKTPFEKNRAKIVSLLKTLLKKFEHGLMR